MSVETRARVLPRIENNTRLLTGQILPDDPLRPDRTQIQYALGSRELVISLPKSPINGGEKSHLYFHGGLGFEGVLPDVTEDRSIAGRFVVDFESGKRDADFILSSGTAMRINLLGLNNRVRAHAEVSAGSVKELVISAEGERNRWLQVKSGKAAELHAYGNDPGTDDDLRIVIEQGGSVGQLHLYDHAAAHTPQLDKLDRYIDELHVYGDAHLNDIKLAPGNTLADMPGLIARGRAGSRRTVAADTFHPSTPSDRRRFDDPQEKIAADLEEEEKARKAAREIVLQERQEWVLQQETVPVEPRLLQDWYYTGRREKRPWWARLMRRDASRKELQESEAATHVSLHSVDAENRFIPVIIRNAFYKAKIDFTDQDANVAAALAMIAMGSDTLPPVGKRVYIPTEDALRLIAEKDQHYGLKRAIEEFIEGRNANSYLGMNRHIALSELTKRTEDGWGVVHMLDGLIMQELEERIANTEALPDKDPTMLFPKGDLVEANR